MLRNLVSLEIFARVEGSEHVQENDPDVDAGCGEQVAPTPESTRKFDVGYWFHNANILRHISCRVCVKSNERALTLAAVICSAPGAERQRQNIDRRSAADGPRLTEL
jgi:hypothetical protein